MDDCINGLDPIVAESYGGGRPRVGNTYGHVRWRGHRWAHRVVWEAANGPIPAGLWILHACDEPACVNVEHLRLGTVADNQRDMAERKRGRNQNGDLTHCRQGHPLSGPNLYVTPDGRHRHCRACKNIAKRAARRR